MPENRTLTFFGFSKADYVKMFDLRHPELDSMHILDSTGGFNTFTYEMSKVNAHVISMDPLYGLSKEKLQKKVEEAKVSFKDLVSKTQQEFVWTDNQTLEEAIQNKLKVVETFMKDLDEGIKSERYLAEDFPHLRFRDEAFDLALCSHFLFSHTQGYSFEYHLEAILELVRIADEVRIFPLVDLDGKFSEHLGPILQELQNKGFIAEVRQVPYEFQKGGNAMLVVDSSTCEVEAHNNESISEE